MRRMWMGVGFVLIAAMGVSLMNARSVGQPAGGVAADASHKRITVTGTATVAVRPDTARVSFAVRAGGNDFKTAVAECDKQGAEVEKAIKGLKLKGLEVKKGPINLVSTGFGGRGFGGGGPGGFGGGPPPMPGGVGGPQPGGFPGMAGGGGVEVSRTFSVVASLGSDKGAGELNEIVAVSDKILAAGVGAGATESPTFNNQPYGGQFGFGGGGGGFQGVGNNNRIEFYRGNPDTVATLRREVLKLAVDDAIANAKAAAGVAKLTAKDIVTITDQNINGPFSGSVTTVPTGTGRGEVLGEMEMTVQVSVTFSY